MKIQKALSVLSTMLAVFLVNGTVTTPAGVFFELREVKDVSNPIKDNSAGETADAPPQFNSQPTLSGSADKTLNETDYLAGFTVNNNGDATDVNPGNGVCETAAGNGICTLRAAVAEANALAGNDVIGFSPGVTLVTLTAEISISNPADELTINGNGANITTIDGGSASNRIFNLTNAAVTINGVTLSGGRTTGHGGGIHASGGTLVLNGVTVQNNQATSNSTSSNGGGVYVTGGAATAVITNSTFTNNSAYSCGGFAVNIGTAFIANSTFSDNTARGLIGGGLCGQNSSDITVRNITVTGNRVTGAPLTGAMGGGGIRAHGTLDIGNSIVAGNIATAPGGTDVRLDSGTITSAGGNLIGNNADANTSTFATTGTPNANNDYIGTTGSVIDPMLRTLDFSSTGTTKVHLLLQGSPAIDRGIDANAVNPFNNQALTLDQRSGLRILNGGVNVLPDALRVDIGAVEFNATPTAASVSISGQVTDFAGRGVNRAVVSITDASGASHTAVTNPFGYYRFKEVEAGETYIFSVSHKRYQFNPQVVFVAEQVEQLNFTALP